MSFDFPTTHWSVVLTAKRDDTKARAALSELCLAYREPILRYVERVVQGDSSYRYGGRNAEDLTHDFLVKLLEGNMFARLRRLEGRFRVYLLGAVRHFLTHIRQQESAAKRGGGIVHLPLREDILPTEADAGFDAMYDHDWATATIDRAVTALGDSPETQTLLPWLTREWMPEDRARLAAELGMTDTALRVALHRLRKKFRNGIREQIARTVASESEIDAELDHLIRAMNGTRAECATTAGADRPAVIAESFVLHDGSVVAQKRQT